MISCAETLIAGDGETYEWRQQGRKSEAMVRGEDDGFDGKWWQR